MSLRRQRSRSSAGGARRECSRYSLTPDICSDVRLKSTSGQVQHMNKWFDTERNAYQQRQTSRPSTAEVPVAKQRPGCGRMVTQGPLAPHLKSGADLGWMVGHGPRSDIVAAAAAADAGRRGSGASSRPSTGDMQSSFARQREREQEGGRRLTLDTDTLGETLKMRSKDPSWRESSLGPAHHNICPANMMLAQRTDPVSWGTQLPARPSYGARGLGSSHGKPGATWATHTWRNGLSEDPKAGAPIRDDSRADYVVYDHTTGGRCPGRPAGGSASHGGLLAQRGYAFFYGRPSGA